MKQFTIIIILFFFLPSCKEGNAKKMQSKNNEPKKSSLNINPPKIGSLLPSIQFKSGKADVNLNEIISKKKSILIFYRGSWCPYCNIHFSKIQMIENDLIKLGFQIIAISPDKLENIETTVKKYKVPYSILSDNELVAAKKLGIAFKVDDNTIEKYKNYDIDLEKASGKSHHMLPVPSVFLIDTNQKIKFIYTNENYKVRLSNDELMKAAKSF